MNLLLPTGKVNLSQSQLWGLPDGKLLAAKLQLPIFQRAFASHSLVEMSRWSTRNPVMAALISRSCDYHGCAGWLGDCVKKTAPCRTGPPVFPSFSAIGDDRGNAHRIYMGETRFGIIRTLPEGTPQWVEEVESLDEAKTRLLRLASKEPGEFFIYSGPSGIIVERFVCVKRRKALLMRSGQLRDLRPIDTARYS